LLVVIPAKAGIQFLCFRRCTIPEEKTLDSGLRRNDKLMNRRLVTIHTATFFQPSALAQYSSDTRAPGRFRYHERRSPGARACPTLT